MAAKTADTDRSEDITSLWRCVYDAQAQVVLAFEQSLTNMTQRLQQLAVTASMKVSNLISEPLTTESDIYSLLYTVDCELVKIMKIMNRACNAV